MAKCNEPLNKSRYTQGSKRKDSKKMHRLVQQIMYLIIFVLFKSNPCLSMSSFKYFFQPLLWPIFMTRARGHYNKIKTTQLAGTSIGHGSEEAPCLDSLLPVEGKFCEVWWKSDMKFWVEFFYVIFVCA